MGCGSSAETKKQTADEPKQVRKPRHLPPDAAPHARQRYSDALRLRVITSDGLQDTLVQSTGTAALPAHVRDAGFAAIDALRDVVIASFADDDLGSSAIVVEQIRLLGLQALQTPILQHAGYNGSLRAFVNDCAECLKMNPILVAFAAELVAVPNYLDAFPIKCEARDRDIRVAVAFSYVLNGINLASMAGSMATAGSFLEVMVTTLLNRKNSLEWEPYFNLFERMKIPSVALPVEGLFLNVKKGTEKVDDEASTGILLSLNILEACYQDTKVGHEMNADAGFELMIESNDHAAVQGLENDINRQLDRGIISIKPSLPVQWADLYQSWNMSFVCSHYSNWPLILSKLACPSVAGMYRRVDPGLYMYPRVQALYVMLMRLIFERAEAKSPTPVNYLEWRDPETTLLWGKLNQAASAAFHRRIEAAVAANGLISTVSYKAKRAFLSADFAMFQGMISLPSSIEGAFADDVAPAEYRRVAEKTAPSKAPVKAVYQ